MTESDKVLILILNAIVIVVIIMITHARKFSSLRLMVMSNDVRLGIKFQGLRFYEYDHHL